MGLKRFQINQKTVTEEEDRTLGEVLESEGVGRDKTAYFPDNPSQAIPMDTRVAELEGRKVGVVEPATLG